MIRKKPNHQIILKWSTPQEDMAVLDVYVLTIICSKDIKPKYDETTGKIFYSHGRRI